MKASDTRRFHLGDILSVTTECLVSPRHMEGVHDLLDFMTGDALFTHQLPRAADECKPHLLALHPDLAAVQVPDFSAVPRDQVEAHVMTWLDTQVAQYGEYRDVAPVPAGGHTVIDPLDELAMNHPHLTVIPVVLPGGGDPR